MGTESSGSGTGADATTRIPDATTSGYLDGLRAALSDLPADELGEITEDARGHLADLAAELGADYDRAAVHARLGSPWEYAVELRSAAGFPAPPASSHRLSRWSARFAVLALVGAVVGAGLGGLDSADSPGVGALILALLVSGVGVLAVLRDGPRLPSVASLDTVALLGRRLSEGTSSGGVTAFLASLQPGWWVLRGVTGAGLLALIFSSAGSWELLVAVLVALVAVPISVVLGARTRADRRLLWVVVPLNAFAVGALAGVVLTLAGFGDRASSTEVRTPGLVQDGEQVSDVRPFDSAGRPLSGVYLFEEDGRPLSVTDPGCGAGERASGNPGPYPRGTTSYAPDTGACVRVPPGPMVVSIPGAAPATRTAPAPAPAIPAPATPAPATPAPATPPPGPR